MHVFTTAIVVIGAVCAAHTIPQQRPPVRVPPLKPPILRPGEKNDSPSPLDLTVARIEGAHHKALWDQTEAFAMCLSVQLRGNSVFYGGFIWDHHNNRLRMEGSAEGDPVLIFDGSKAWVSGEADTDPPAYLQLRDWPMLLGAPFALSEDGVKLESYETRNVLERSRTPFRVHFADTAEDDWCVGYVELTTGRLVQLVFLNGLGLESKDDNPYRLRRPGSDPAAPQPMAVVFDKFFMLDGITLPGEWRLYEWSADTGRTGNQIGTIKIAKPQFIEPVAEMFVKEDGMKESTPPEKK